MAFSFPPSCGVQGPAGQVRERGCVLRLELDGRAIDVNKKSNKISYLEEFQIGYPIRCGAGERSQRGGAGGSPAQTAFDHLRMNNANAL
jgi:hypothetical protein